MDPIRLSYVETYTWYYEAIKTSTSFPNELIYCDYNNVSLLYTVTVTDTVFPVSNHYLMPIWEWR
jgi:hypothetical protein